MAMHVFKKSQPHLSLCWYISVSDKINKKSTNKNNHHENNVYKINKENKYNEIQTLIKITVKTNKHNKQKLIIQIKLYF